MIILEQKKSEYKEIYLGAQYLDRQEIMKNI